MNFVLCGRNFIIYCVMLFFFKSGTSATVAGDPGYGNFNILNIQLGI
jgi:hypothetical protein